MSIPPNHYIINNQYVSSTYNETKISAFDSLICIPKPIYHIPLHILAGVFLTIWRNQADTNSFVDLTARRVLCTVGFAALSLVGIVDTLARLVLAGGAYCSQKTREHTKEFLDSADIGFKQSLGFISILQYANWKKEKL